MNNQKIRKIVVTCLLPQMRAVLDTDEFAGITVRYCDQKEEILAEAVDADVLCVADVDEDVLRVAEGLRWIQLMRGGVSRAFPKDFVESPIIVTCLKELFATPGAEFSLMAMLMVQRRMAWAVGRPKLAQNICSMDPELGPSNLAGRTAGIIGLGNIGMRTAELCRAFGMRVLGTARTRKSADSLLLDAFFPMENWHAMLAESDFVVTALPLTRDTGGVLGDAAFRAFKSGAWLIDTSARPPLLDYAALERALDEGILAGAFLQPAGDTYQSHLPEKDAPLWKRENVVVSPCRAVSVEQTDAAIRFFPENLRRWLEGGSPRGLVDKKAGY